MSINAVWPEGYERRILDTVDSTLDEASRQAASLSGPTWILAHAQTKARGRRGREWRNPKGNFAATLVLQPNQAPGVAALRSFVAALALHDALTDVTQRPTGLALKWPNDVLLNGGKVSGMLLESAGAASGALSHLAIGIGVNLVDAPSPDEVEARAVRPVSVLSETGIRVDSETFLTYLAAAYARYETQFASYGFEPIRLAWLARAARLGEPLTARTPKQETHGTFESVDAEGNLVLKTPKGLVAIPAADVFF